MGNPIQREKMYEALGYFSLNVRHAGHLKLYKLLYYLDLMHFRRTGRTVTGLSYHALPKGPVPQSLFDEVKDPGSELAKRFTVQIARRTVDKSRLPTVDSDPTILERAMLGEDTERFVPGSIKPKSPHHHLYLSKREQEIARQLSEIFRDATAEQMTDISHHKFGPWRKALFKAKKSRQARPVIDLLEGAVAVGKPEEELSKSELLEIIAERDRFDEAMR